MEHLKGPIRYRYMLFWRGLDHKPFASKGTGTPQRNSEYSPLPLSPKLCSYKSTYAQMKLLLYCWRPCLSVTTTLFHLYFVFTTVHPLCMLKMGPVRVLCSGQRWTCVHNLIFCIFRRCYNMTFRIQGFYLIILQNFQALLWWRTFFLMYFFVKYYAP